jgi:hypothetical protein
VPFLFVLAVCGVSELIALLLEAKAYWAVLTPVRFAGFFFFRVPKFYTLFSTLLRIEVPSTTIFWPNARPLSFSSD